MMIFKLRDRQHPAGGKYFADKMSAIRQMKWLSAGIMALTLLLFGAVLFRAIAFQPAPSTAADYFFQRSIADTGAINIVTAIYLGYRAFDTLGETIVLMLAVSGVVWLIGKKS